MPASSLYANAIEAIYAAAASTERWRDALEAIAAYFGDVGANLIYSRDDGSTATIVSAGLQAAHDDYQRGWWEQDIRWIRARDFVYRSQSGAVSDRHLVTDEEQATHPFYTDFQKRHGLRWIASVEVSPEPFALVALSVHRAPARQPYSDDELETFAGIGRHVEQALRLSIRLLRAEMTNAGLSEVLTHMNTGVFVLDGSGRVIHANPAATRLTGDGLRLAGGRLLIGNAQSHQTFQNRLAGAIGDLLSGTPDYLKPTLIERSGNRRPLVIYILPIRSAAHNAFDHFLGQAKAVLVLRDLDEQDATDPAMVRDILGVTLAEARVASLVATGVSPRDAATTLGIKEETARSALKRVFAKSGLSRQSELSALLGKLAFQLPT